MGVDYRNRDPNAMNTNLGLMKFTPAVAYEYITFAVGFGLPVDFQTIDLGQGESHNFAAGAHFGILYRMGSFAFGASYETEQGGSLERIYDFDNDGHYDTLDLRQPQTVGVGVAYKSDKGFFVEGNVKWLDWKGAKGYKDFDWESRFVFGIGAQYEVAPWIRLRMGYNYGKSPVKEHNGWNPSGTVSIQGKTMTNFGYEYFRIVGLPAITEHHFTAGAGVDLARNITLNVAFVYGFKNDVKAVSIKSTLRETSLDVGMTWRF